MPITKLLWREKTTLAALISAIIVVALERKLFSDLSNHVLLTVLFSWLFIVILFAAFNIVRHAEFLAHKYGEPYGTLILTISAVSVEVIMLAAIMLHDDHDPKMARDTMYSVIMIVMNGLIGLSLLLGGIKHGEQKYNLKSATSYFPMILTLVALGFFVPKVIPQEFLRTYEIFLMVISILLYLSFLRIQTAEHSYFFTFKTRKQPLKKLSKDHGPSSASYHIVILLVTLGTMVFLAESLGVVMDEGVDLLGVPEPLSALLVALLILSAEGLTAIRAARANEMQRVVNICLGSALSTIGLTIPVILIIGLITGKTVILGINPLQAVLLGATILIGISSYKQGEKGQKKNQRQSEKKI